MTVADVGAKYASQSPARLNPAMHHLIPPSVICVAGRRLQRLGGRSLPSAVDLGPTILRSETAAIVAGARMCAVRA